MTDIKAQWSVQQGGPGLPVMSAQQYHLIIGHEVECSATAAGVKMEKKDSLSEKQKDVICEKYHKVVVDNLDAHHGV